ncbi:MAG: twin-arginine translocation signal domain-containing protein [Pseudonocardiaceae bacterium]|nr:MAG: twin-arginine translocation signal domain-containing protein [Pseudonocardiaceae bacterium]
MVEESGRPAPTRRSFLRTAGVGAAVLGVAACTNTPATAPVGNTAQTTGTPAPLPPRRATPSRRARRTRSAAGSRTRPT